MSLILDIADAVVAELNDHEWLAADDTFTAERRYQPYLKPEDLTDLRVSVILRAYEGQLGSRGVGKRIVVVQVLVQREQSDANEDNDPIIALAEEIADRFEGWKHEGNTCVSAQVSPIYAPDHIRDRVVTSVVELQFIAHKNRG